MRRNNELIYRRRLSLDSHGCVKTVTDFPLLNPLPSPNFKSLISRYFYYFYPNFLRLSVTIARLVKTYLPDGMSSHSLGDGRWMSCPDVDKPESEHDFCKSFERTLLEVNSS